MFTSRTQSRAVSKKIELLGQIFGRLTVIGESKTRGHGGSLHWDCRCVCGSNKTVTCGDLRSGHIQSCGCLQHENGQHKKLRPFEALYNIFVKMSIKRSIECLLTYDDFVKFTSTTACYYCGGSITWTEHNTVKNGQNYNLDRIDSQQGYTFNNCVVACYTCNAMKLLLSGEAFLKQIEKIHSHQLRRKI